MSAIQQDVPNNEQTPTEEAKPRQLSAREQQMEMISGKRRAQLEEETGLKIEDAVVTADPDTDPDAAQADAERVRLEQEQAQLQQPTPEQEPEPKPAAVDLKARVKVKIDGVEQEVSTEELLREYQKGRTADKRLEQAARERRELEEQQRQLQAQAAQIPPHPVVSDEEALKKFTSALRTGDEEQVTQAFQEAVSSAVAAATAANRGAQVATPVDPVAIAAQVRQQIAIDSVLAQSRADYPELYSDPDIEAIAAAKIDRLQAEGTPWAEALENVQSDLAKKFGWKKAAGRQTPAQASSRREEKLARKAEIDDVGPGPNVKSTNAMEQPVQTASSIIEEMRRSRLGQSI